jgi:glucose/arabinose dehydrogenase
MTDVARPRTPAERSAVRIVSVLVGAIALSLVSACASAGSENSDGSGTATGRVSAPATIVPPRTEVSTAPSVTDGGTTTTLPPSAGADLPSGPPPSGPDTTPPTTQPGPLPEPAVGLAPIGEFERPLEVEFRPRDDRLFVVEQSGRVLSVSDLATDVVLDLRGSISDDGERGLLGLSFHPDRELAYVDYTDQGGDTVVAEFVIDPVTAVFDPESARTVLTIEQPFSNHNGGELDFGPDGNLYIGVGDGGSGGDPQRNALDLATRLGKILRIDPLQSTDAAFSVPDDNPFVDVEGADPTIWSYGLRNPWRFSFDSATGDLWIADVGQNAIEEVDHAPATNGRNAGRGLGFGWSALEGNDRFNDDQPPENQVPPVVVYDHSDGNCSISGGAVYRGTLVPGLQGWYVYGDLCSGTIWGYDPTSTSVPRVVVLANLPQLAAVATGPDGELYAVSNAGTVARFIPA